MTDQLTDTPVAIPYAPIEKSTGSEADVVDQAGNAILGLVDRAADMAEADVQGAQEVAEKLADQLRAAQEQINNLEAKVRYYEDRTDRAEKWLHKISSKIEQRFFDATGRQALVPPIEELIEEETQRIAAKFAPDFSRASRN